MTTNLIGKHHDGLCAFCKVKEDVEHYLLNCIEFINHQEIMINEMVKENVNVTLVNLLKNKFEDKIFMYIINTKKVL